MQHGYSQKLQSLVLLRAIAVLSVCCCHFSKPLSEGFEYSYIFRFLNNYGKYGVEIFFVISGFVIPLSLEKGGYAIQHYIKFLYKRLIRLHPAYLCSIVLTLIVTYVSFKQKHEPFPETTSTISESIFLFQNLGLNPVYWTLRVEAEYYLFIGLFFVLLKKHTHLSYLVFIPLLLIASQFTIANHIELLHHLVYFFIGAVGCLIYIKHGNSTIHYIFLVALIIFSFFYGGLTRIVEAVPATIAAVIAITTILFYKKTISKTPVFLGKISYSLYLIHYPVSKQIIRLFMKLLPQNIAWLLFIIAFIIVIPIAWLLYKFVEVPSENASQIIKYKTSI